MYGWLTDLVVAHAERDARCGLLQRQPGLARDDVGLALDKPAEANALHPSTDDEAAGLHFCCHGALSK